MISILILYHNFTISCFNCSGFQGSLGYVTKLVNECDITFICEHWLHPGELFSVFQNFNDKACFLKSCVKPKDIILHGRPYGGTGFICSNRKNVSFKNIGVDSHRICSIEVLVHGKIILSVIGIYLPHEDRSQGNMKST